MRLTERNSDLVRKPKKNYKVVLRSKKYSAYGLKGPGLVKDDTSMETMRAFNEDDIGTVEDIAEKCYLAGWRDCAKGIFE